MSFGIKVTVEQYNRLNEIMPESFTFWDYSQVMRHEEEYELEFEDKAKCDDALKIAKAMRLKV